jgi:DNA-binding MltR family transcriptional regulator
MSAKKALKRLMDQFPKSEDLQRQFEALRDNTDMSVAIVATSIVERVLEKALVSAFLDKDDALQHDLFANRGPLCDFHGKILVGRAYGVVSAGEAAELQILKAIRNAFAHSPIEISFATKEIADLMREIEMLNIMDRVAVDPELKSFAPRDKAGFLMVAQILCVMLDANLQRRGAAPVIQKYKD